MWCYMIGVLTNDFDADGDALSLTENYTRSTPWAQVVRSGNALVVTPKPGAANSSGAGTGIGEGFSLGRKPGLSYEVEDGKGGRAIGSLVLNIIPGASPTVSLTLGVTLTNGATAAASIPLTNTFSAASNPEVDTPVIKQIEFFANNRSIGKAANLVSGLSSPYVFTWKNMPQGDYSLTAQATDSLGYVGMSSPIQVRVSRNNTGNHLAVVSLEETSELQPVTNDAELPDPAARSFVPVVRTGQLALTGLVADADGGGSQG